MYTDALWNEWEAIESRNYKVTGTGSRTFLKRGYVHLDKKIWFPEKKNDIQQILKSGLKVFNRTHQRLEWYDFDPFIKILHKTPRYKWQEDEEKYDLESKIRPISFASHRDSLVLGFYAFALNQQYQEYIRENGFSECVLAYRSDLDGKCNIQFSKEVFSAIKARGECTAVALDIKGYFDHIDHRLLKQKWAIVIGGELPEDQYKIYKAITRYSYLSKNSVLKKYGIKKNRDHSGVACLLDVIPGKKEFEKFQRLRKDRLVVVNKKNIGIPQGSAMSALLSNIFLVDFDRLLFEKSNREGFIYRRYCDDIIFICRSEDAAVLKQFAIDTIKEEYGLTIQESKVEITKFAINQAGKLRAFDGKKMQTEGLDIVPPADEKNYYRSLQYLGFEFNGQKIFLRASSLSRYFRKMKRRIHKTVKMALSDNAVKGKLWREQLYHRYTHLGKRNFLSYAYNAAAKEYTNAAGQTKEGMNSSAIRQQLKRHFSIMLTSLEKSYRQRQNWKLKRKESKT